MAILKNQIWSFFFYLSEDNSVSIHQKWICVAVCFVFVRSLYVDVHFQFLLKKHSLARKLFKSDRTTLSELWERCNWSSSRIETHKTWRTRNFEIGWYFSIMVLGTSTTVQRPSQGTKLINKHFFRVFGPSGPLWSFFWIIFGVFASDPLPARHYLHNNNEHLSGKVLLQNTELQRNKSIRQMRHRKGVD